MKRGAGRRARPGLMFAAALLVVTAPGLAHAGLDRGSLAVLPSLGIDLGGGWRISGANALGFQLSVDAGLQLGWPGRSGVELLLVPALWVMPRLGYAYRSQVDTLPDSHFLSVGLGVGYGQLLSARGLYLPRFLVGKVGSEVALGLRHGLAGSFLLGIFNVELAHQVEWSAGLVQHQVLISLGINVGPPLYLYVKHGR